MPPDFVSLNCQSCGGKLDVYADMDRFACGYCGTELTVQRRGGTVALKAVTEAIKKVEISTDKAAAEVALMRCEAEERDLTDRASSLRKKRDDELGKALGCTVVPALVAFLMLAAGAGKFGVAVLVFGIVAACAWWKEIASKNRELSDMEARMQALHSKMNEKRRLVED